MTSAAEKAAQPAVTLSWRAHPAAERPGAAVLAGAAIIALAALVAMLMASPWWGALALGILLAALNRFFLPSRFSIDEEGITAAYALGQQRLRWADVRRFAHDERGALLGSRARGSLRGLHIIFPAQRQDVLDHIRACLPQDRGT